MKSFHTFASTRPPTGNPGDVDSPQWNDIHQSGVVPTLYAAAGIVPASVDYIRAVGGAGGIQLQLTPSSQTLQGASGQFQFNQVYFAKKVDAAGGAVTFVSVNGELIEGQPNYALTQQGQWAIFIWNPPAGANPGFWEVFGGQIA